MFITNLYKRIFDLSVIKKAYLGIISIALLFSLTIFYLNFLNLKTQKRNQIEHEIHLIENRITETIDSYKEMMQVIGKKLSTDSINKDPQKISLLLKQFYLNNKNYEESEIARIEFLDLSWHNKKENISVNRYSLLDSKIDLPANLEDNLITFPGKIFIFTKQNNLSLTAHEQVYLVMGITNDKKEYIGNLSILLDIDSWISSLKQRFDRTNNVLAVTSDKGMILQSTSVDLNGISINNKLLLSHKNHSEFKVQNYLFANYIAIPSSPLSIMIGYNKKQFVDDLIEIIKPQFLILFVSSLISALLFYIFRRKIKDEVQKNFSDDLTKVQTENITLQDELNKLTNQFAEEIDSYKSKLKFVKDSLEAHKISNLEANNLLFDINKSILDSLNETKELAGELIQSRNSDQLIKLTFKEEVSLLNEIYGKISYISNFCAIYNNEKVDVEEIIDSSIKLYTKEIFLKNIKLDSAIDENIGNIEFSNLLLKQIIVSLLYISFEAARSSGEIKFEAYTKKIKNKQMLVILIKDDGFYLNEVNKGSLEKTLFKNKISPLHLSLNNVKNILENHSCEMNVTYNNEGKILELIIPYENQSHKKETYDTKANNVIQFKK